MNDQYVERSVNGIKEYRNYLWKTDSNGQTINEPIDIFNHFLDAVRYGFSSYRPTIINNFTGTRQILR